MHRRLNRKQKKHTMSAELYFPRENILPQLKMTKYQKDFHFMVYYFILENF